VTKLDGAPVRDAADLQPLLRIAEFAEFAVSRPDSAVTVRAAMTEREPAARSKGCPNRKAHQQRPHCLGGRGRRSRTTRPPGCASGLATCYTRRFDSEGEEHL
jgi:hypothetical protein